MPYLQLKSINEQQNQHAKLQYNSMQSNNWDMQKKRKKKAKPGVNQMRLHLLKYVIQPADIL